MSIVNKQRGVSAEFRAWLYIMTQLRMMLYYWRVMCDSVCVCVMCTLIGCVYIYKECLSNKVILKKVKEKWANMT